MVWLFYCTFRGECNFSTPHVLSAKQLNQGVADAWHFFHPIHPFLGGWDFNLGRCELFICRRLGNGSEYLRVNEINIRILIQWNTYTTAHVDIPKNNKFLNIIFI